MSDYIGNLGLYIWMAGHMLLPLIMIVVLFVLVPRLRERNTDPAAILSQRYAKGEISEEEYRRMQLNVRQGG